MDQAVRLNERHRRRLPTSAEQTNLELMRCSGKRQVQSLAIHIERTIIVLLLTLVFASPLHERFAC